MRNVALAYVIGLAVSLAVAVVFLACVWVFGGLNTSGKYLDWEVVGAVATAIAAAAALGALVGVVFGLDQLRATQRAERLSLMPYLRVDTGFIGQQGLQPGFSPPPAGRVFSASDFGPGVDAGDLASLRPDSPDEPAFDLGLWVTNQQSAPLGVAYQIEIGLFVAWRTVEDQAMESGPLSQAAQVVVRFAYVEPGKTTVLRLGRVKSATPELVVTVFSVSYYGMYRDRELRNRHGSLNLYYDSSRGRAQNDRSYGLGEGP